MKDCYVCNNEFKDYGRQKFCSIECRSVWFSDKELTTNNKDNTMKNDKCKCIQCSCKNCDC